MKLSPLTIVEQEEIISLYLTGKKVDEIVEILKSKIDKLTKWRILGTLKRHFIPRRSRANYAYKHSPETKAKLCLAAKTRVHHPHSEETKIKLSLAKLGELNPNYGKLTNTMIENLKKGHERVKSLTEKEYSSWVLNLSEKCKKNWEKGTYDGVCNNGGNSKSVIYKGFLCKGNGEKKFINDYSVILPEILVKPHRVKTPFGTYSPDFETSKYFVELKSEWTYECFLGLHDYIGNIEKGNIRQLTKIEWCSKKIKEVKVIILYRGKFYDEKKFIESYNKDLILNKAIELKRYKLEL